MSKVPRHIFEARLRNAQRIGERIADYLARGFLVFDGSGDPVERVYLEGFDENPGLSVGNEHFRVVYFDGNPEADNGAFDTIAEFNATFAKWTVLDPADKKPLI